MSKFTARIKGLVTKENPEPADIERTEEFTDSGDAKADKVTATNHFNAQFGEHRVISVVKDENTEPKA